MVDIIAIIALGFLLGMRHATDADHVIAVTTIVTRERDLKQAALIGIAWGGGHSLTVVTVGSAIIALRLVLPPRLGLTMELAVAVMLIFLGIRNMRGLLGRVSSDRNSDPPRLIGEHCVTGAEPHGHGHLHPQVSAPVRLLDRYFGPIRWYRFMRPLMIGIVHGLAGSAAIALLVLSTIHNVRWSVVYLLIFSAGTIVGMLLVTMTLASAFRFSQARLRLGRHFGLAAGIISLVFGMVLTYQIGFVHGLFTAHASWVPR